MSHASHYPLTNFRISNDRVLDHLRVRQPNTFKIPPATRNLIDPNVPVDPDVVPIVLVGDNNPVTNSTLRSGVAQAGALVYCTTPIINPLDDPPTDGCFDNRNHLYFSDGDQWIPLANCLPSSEPSSGGGGGGGESFVISGGGDNPYSVDPEDSGKTAFFTGESISPQEIILPDISGPDSNGLRYKFVIGSDYEGEKRIIWANDEVADLFVGTVNWGNNGGDTSDVGDKTIIFAPSANATSGDFIQVYSFDGKWYVTGECWLDNSIEFGPLNPCEGFYLKQSLTAAPWDFDANDQFGTSIAISGDYAIVGAPREDDPATDAGAAYIFKKIYGGPNRWMPIQKLIGIGSTTGDLFGSSVSIDGDRAIVGAPAAASSTGVAFIFQKDEGGPNNWGQVQALQYSDAAQWNYFGYSVSISGDIAIVGAYNAVAFSGEGKAYIYYKDYDPLNPGTPSVNNWGEKKAFSGAAVGDNFGWSVSISGDYAIVGANLAEAAYIYYKNEGTDDNWGEQKELANPGGAGNKFGNSVAINGEDAIVGMDISSAANEKAYIYYKNEGTPNNWGEKAVLENPIAVNSQFGFSVAIRGDYAIVGAPGTPEGVNELNAGATHIFNRNCGGSDLWGQAQEINLPHQPESQLGYSVAIEHWVHGITPLSGAPLHDDTATHAASGVVRIFTRY